MCQIFTSALPVAYNHRTNKKDFEPFAKLILVSAFDSVLAAAHLLSIGKNKRIKVFLTAIGCGVFGNKPEWAAEAI